MSKSVFSMVIPPRNIDLEGFPVDRLLPHRGVRGIGPWVFFDRMGPYDFPSGYGIDVIPHPHIGLATVTYLFDGCITHRDSLGNNQEIRPGEINLMVAGSGIVHSERTPVDFRSTGQHVHGIQLWHALPVEYEEKDPSFHHYGVGDIPVVEQDRVTIRVLMGTVEGITSPVKLFIPTIYVEIRMLPGGRWKLPEEVSEQAIYCIEGRVQVDGEPLEPGCLSVLQRDAGMVEAAEETRLILIGGDSPGDRFIWWNYVSSQKERIDRARLEWNRGGFPEVPGDSGERAVAPDSDGHARMLS